MDLSDALGDWPGGNPNQQQSGGPWPGQTANPAWPGQPAPNPTWPGGQPAPNPTWPGGQPAANPTWPGGQPGPNPTWPGGQPAANPSWPGGQPAANPSWPGGQPAANPTWPGGPAAGQGVWSGGSPGQPFSSFGPGPGPEAIIPTQKNLTVPYEEKLPNGVYDKLLITVTGTIKPNADKFTINLLASDDVAFHFNPRFNESGRQVIVRNTSVGKKWGKEERDLKHFPFSRGQPFEVKILCTNHEFKVAVNKSHLLEYKHRIQNLRSINKLGIYFDLSLSGVKIETMS